MAEFVQALSRLGERIAPFVIPPLGAADELRVRLGWLALLRWLVLAGQFLFLFTSLRLKLVWLPLSPLLYLLIGGLSLANIWACYSLNRQRLLFAPQAELLFWLLLDWAQFLLMISLTGGIYNPFYPLIFVHAVLGAVLLPWQLGGVFLGVLGGGIYLLEPPMLFVDGNQSYFRSSVLVSWAIQFGVLATVWAFAGWTARRLRESRRQAAALRESQQRLRRVHLLGALGAGVAHEFATPLNTLRLRLERLERRPNPEDVKAALEALEQCESRLRSMAALPSGSDLDRLEPLELADYLPQWVARWREGHSAPMLKLELEFSLAGICRARLPELVLRQALGNLLDNAAEAMDDQGCITLSCVQDGDWLNLEVRDRGPGWPENVRRHLGEPFVTTREQGTGLGLYTVHMLAEALGGSLELSDIPGGGACVRLRLPLSL